LLENIAYCPILHSRVAEVKALLNLPSPTKDRLLPIVASRPWPNAKELARTWGKLSEALGARRFGLDLDRTKFRAATDKPAGYDFDRLFDPVNGFENYYQLVGTIASAIPVLRLNGVGADGIAPQASWIEALDKGVVIRIEHDHVIDPIGIVREALNKLPDITVVIDAGWSLDVLGRELWASRIISEITDKKPETEIIVSASSFPSSFSHIQGRGEKLVDERALYNNLVRRHNAATLIYGDWGSTRPPSPPSPMRNIPRIDLPMSDEWVFFRQTGAEGYAEIANRMMLDGVWPNNLNIWGTYMIGATAEGAPGSIQSPGTAAAARINIHLHRQSHYGMDGYVNDGDEPFTDDI
jgi:hypothetical protein